MLSYTLDNALILTIFQLLISGLIVCGSCAVLYLQKDPSVRKILGLTATAFSLYSLHFLLKASFFYQSFSLSAPATVPAQGELLVRVSEEAALVFLGLSFLFVPFAEKPHYQFWAVAGAAFALLTAGAYLAETHLPSTFSRVSPWELANGLWLAGIAALNLHRIGRTGLLAGGALGVFSAAQFLRAASRGVADKTWLWSIESAAVLAGLGLFALVVEKWSAHLPVRFFMRLNLIFVAVASMLILLVAEMERREYLLIAESNTEELSEYLRGQLLNLHYQGIEPREILSHPDIVGKVASDFARLPDLRQVRVVFQGWAMEMTIGENWVVTQQVHPAAPTPPGPRRDSANRVATLRPVLIEQNGKVVGSIELEQSLRTINTQIARHMQIIFLIFTVAVFVAASLIGFTAQQAHKTIQRQLDELEKTNAHLLHMERLASVGQLAGGIAHEINNPAGIILTTSDCLLREAEKQSFPERFREDLQIIRRQARRVSEVVNGLLTFSRPTALARQSIDINIVVQQSLGLLAPRFREGRVQVEERLTPALPAISADPDRLEQVFVNLLNNAADAMPNGGHIRVETKVSQVERASSVVVSVTDSGTGIAEEHLKSIFDPFFSTKPKGRGTGLGLSVSHGIIRSHGGRIEVESELGRGTTFRVYLALQEEGIEKV